MTPAQIKAKELVDRYMRYVYCYMGSGMLTNDYDEIVALSNAKQCALICVDEILNVLIKTPLFNGLNNIGDVTYDFWQSVKQSINEL